MLRDFSVEVLQPVRPSNGGRNGQHAADYSGYDGVSQNGASRRTRSIIS